MRANRDAAKGGDYDITYVGTPTHITCTGTCSKTQVAQMDVELWRAYVERLPSGEGQVSVTAAGLAEVQVCWSDVRGTSIPCSNANSDKQKLITRAQL